MGIEAKLVVAIVVFAGVAASAKCLRQDVQVAHCFCLVECLLVFGAFHVEQ